MSGLILPSRFGLAHVPNTGPSDPYWSSVARLVPPAGADGSTYIADSKSGTWSNDSSLVAITSATAPFAGSKSLGNSSGTTSRSISSASSSCPSDFTWELWAKSDDTSGTKNIAGLETTGSNYWSLMTASGNLNLYVGSNRIVLTGGASWLSAGWCFLVVTRSGTTVELVAFESDGTRHSGTWVNSPVTEISGFPWMFSPGGVWPFIGNIAQFRLTPGVVRDTTQRPDAAFPTK